MTQITFKTGGRNSGKTFELQQDFYTKWSLSTEGYYFQYRADRHDSSILRATLYRTRDNSVADDVRVSSYGPDYPHKSHHDLINYFEARLQLNLIK